MSHEGKGRWRIREGGTPALSPPGEAAGAGISRFSSLQSPPLTTTHLVRDKDKSMEPTGFGKVWHNGTKEVANQEREKRSICE